MAEDSRYNELVITVKRPDAGANIVCGDVIGNVSAGDTAECGDVSGNVSAGDIVDCGDVGGSISTKRK